MKKSALFTVLGIVIVLFSVFAVIFFTRDPSRPEDPVEEAMRSTAVYTEEGYLLNLSEDGSYYTFRIGKCNDKNIVIPAYYNNIPITAISSQAFHGHRDIETISIPDTVTVVDFHMNLSDIDYESLKLNKYGNGYYLGNDKNPYRVLMYCTNTISGSAAVHPDTKVIAYGAFANSEELTSLTLPQGLESIGIHAFLRCKSLKQVTIPDSVTHVGEYTFSQCESLQSVTLGSGLTEISDRMFADCSSLKSVTMEGKIIRIGEGAFSHCSSLESFEIPKTVKSIEGAAFAKCEALKKITIHKGIDTLPIDVFPETADYNEYLGGLYLGDSENPYLYLIGISDSTASELTLHRNIYSITEKLISANQSLTDLKVEGGNGLYLRSEGNCIIRKNGKILLCGIGTSVIPSKGISQIAPCAFYHCMTLRRVIIPDSVTSIGERAFYNGISISELTIGEKVKNIGEYAFANCESLERVELPGGLYELPKGCFRDCTLLRDVSISDKTEIIGEDAFGGCNSLTSISLPGVKVICNMAFSSCKVLENVSLSENLGYIGNSAFSSCTALKDIVLPYGLRYIGGSAFKNCDSLKYLNIPKSIEKFGTRVYSQCDSIEYVTIPEGNESISAREFELCTNLKKISLPSTLKEISGYAVLGLCESIEEIVYNGTVEEWNAIEKSDVWYIATPAFKVICTDGEVEYPADESTYVGDGW